MADGPPVATEIASKEDLTATLGSRTPGVPVAGLRAFAQGTCASSCCTMDRPLVLGDDLVLVQDNGTVVVLPGAGRGGLLLQSGDLVVPVTELLALAPEDGAWRLLAEAPLVDLSPFRTDAAVLPASAIDTTDAVLNLPLEGLAISPLLPPTEFFFPEFVEQDVGGGPEAQVLITQLLPVLRIETDAPVTITFSDFFEVTEGQPDFGETITQIGVTILDVPTGAIASAGTVTGSTFSFVGTPAQFETRTLTFPTDFSTQSRIDAPPGPLSGEIFANASFGTGPVQSFPIMVLDEADLDMLGTGLVAFTETDAPLVFRPVEAVRPEATDIDGSE